MGEYTITMPDIGEGIAEAELIEWLVAVGDEVAADAPLAEVTTDKARVQIPSPVAGTVQRLGAEPGDLVAVGAELIRLEVAGRSAAGPDVAAHGAQEQGEKADGAEPQGGQIDGAEARVVQTQVMEDAERQEASEAVDSGVGQAPRSRNGPKVLAAPAVRGRARDAGVSLASVPATGPGARVTAADLETYLRTPVGRLGAVSAGRPGMGVDRGGDAAGPRSRDGVTEIPLRGIRRVISQRLQQTWHEVPHITIVEEVDVTELEDLRARLNEDRGGKGAGRGG
ncbi:MAG: biotin/lipoyl-containing protein, partial [Propionibacteriaceae bacterium]|nr:biotin/lipoyl-containing protein [Propionibacteriaceae bacterium]